MSKVVVTPLGDTFDEAVEGVFESFGGVAALLGGREDVFLKVNAVDFKPYTFTDPEVVAAAIRVLRRGGARRVYVIENCTQGNFTRAVFRVSGLERAVRAAGATPIYLDEGEQVPVQLPTLGYPVRVSRWVKDHLMDGRDRAWYLNMPKLKTHSMSTVTLGVKNQFGLIAQEDRIKDHNWKLHQKFADIFSLVSPDFTLVDGLYAVNYGHYPAEGLAEESVERLGILIGGPDTLAVDAVGADLLGFAPAEVEHLRLAAETGKGTIDLDAIEVEGDRAPYRRSYTCDLLPVFPSNVQLIAGSERCCREGCLMNTMTALQMLYVDQKGQGDFAICMGKGLDRQAVDAIEGKVLVIGDCAMDEVYPALKERLGARAVIGVRGNNNIRDMALALIKLMRVNPLKLFPLPPWEAGWLLFQALRHRTTARIALPFLPR